MNIKGVPAGAVAGGFRVRWPLRWQLQNRERVAFGFQRSSGHTDAVFSR
jgi:hypothetical protein